MQAKERAEYFSVTKNTWWEANDYLAVAEQIRKNSSIFPLDPLYWIHLVVAAADVIVLPIAAGIDLIALTKRKQG